MAENLDVEGRMSVRTPMQWTDGRNAGFSDAPTRKLRRPLPSGPFGPPAVNVADQRRDPDSLLSWMERVIRRRKETPEFGWGVARILETDAPSVLAHRCDWEGSTVLAVHNLADQPRTVQIELACNPDATLVDLLHSGDGAVGTLGGDNVELQLDAYAHRWFRVQNPHMRTTP